MPGFRLQRPTSTREAKDLHEQLPDAVFAAGCTDLIARVREGLPIADLISLRRVDDLCGVTLQDGKLYLGAMLTHDQAVMHQVFRENLPDLADAWAATATVRVRYRATLGGNLMARRPRYEMSLLLSSLEATAVLSQGQQSRRTQVDQLWSPASGGSELLQQVIIETSSLRWFRYDRSMRPLLTLALSIRSTPDGLRLTVAVGSEYRMPFLLRYTVTEDGLGGMSVRDVAQEMAEQVPNWAGDYAGSTAYRTRVVAVLLGRQLQTAQERWVA